MDPGSGVTAALWLATACEHEIAAVLWKYGEERFSRRIARAVVRARNEAPVETTGRLQAIVAAAHPAWEKGKDPATRSFQALRIFLNRELEELEAVLPQTLDLLKRGGRLVVISFHSLEDRQVKRFMRREARGKDLPMDLPIPAAELNPLLKVVGRAVRASAAEVEENPRARSAIMRVAERL